MDITDGTGGFLVAGWAQEAGAHGQACAFTEVEYAGDGQAAAHNVHGQAVVFLPVLAHRHEAGLVAAGGVAGYEQVGRIAGQLVDVVVNPSQPTHGVIQSGREDMGRGQPVTDADEADAGPVEYRRHERHPFLVAAGPAAAVDHDEYVAVGCRGREIEHALVGVRAVTGFSAAKFCRPLQEVFVVLPGKFGDGFLRGVVFRFHGAQAAFSIKCLAASTAEVVEYKPKSLLEAS